MSFEMGALPDAPHVSLSLWSRVKEGVNQLFRNRRVIWLASRLGVEKAAQVERVYKKFTWRETQLQNFQNTTSLFGGETPDQLKKDLSSLNKKPNKKTKFTFTTEDTVTAGRGAKRGEKKVTLLNLANRWQAGGSGLCPYGGSQEEALIRSSNLIWSIDPERNAGLKKKLDEIKKDTPAEGSADHIPYYGAVLSKGVLFFREKKRGTESFDVVSAAAVDRRSGSDEMRAWKSLGKKELERQIDAVTRAKIEALLGAALSAGSDKIVLGAFGCGVFKNDTERVAELFREVLEEEKFKGAFEEVIFAITDEAKKKLFKEAFSETS